MKSKIKIHKNAIIINFTDDIIWHFSDHNVSDVITQGSKEKHISIYE